jgi:hypothetical protein
MVRRGRLTPPSSCVDLLVVRNGVIPLVERWAVLAQPRNCAAATILNARLTHEELSRLTGRQGSGGGVVRVDNLDGSGVRIQCVRATYYCQAVEVE